MNYSFFDKDISKLFKHIHISKNCEIYCNNVRSIIYQIFPINIIDVNEEYKEKIYNAYYTFIKAMPDNVQIISIKDTIDFSKAIQKVRRRLNVVNSETLRFAIVKYIEKLKEILNKGLEKKDKFLNQVKEWYNLYNNMAFEEMNTIATRLNRKRDVINMYPECAKENGIIQNICKMVNSKNEKLSDLQLQLCTTL